MSIVKMFKKENKIFRIYNDISPEKPEMYGHIFHWHPRYDLGKRIKPEDTKETLCIQEWEQFLNLFLYDHGDIKLSIRASKDRFDSGHVGYIGVTREEFRQHFGESTCENSKKSCKTLEESLLTYTAYLNGEVYEWDVQEVTTCKECGHIMRYETIDGCRGYYGVDSWEQMKKDAGVDETWEEVNA